MRMIQTNAIRSWLAFCPPCEILLLGDDEGTAEIARQFGVRHIPDIDCNEFGTPLISSLFQTAQDAAKHELLCEISADIMLTDDFLPAIEKVYSRKQKFLVVGQRWNVDIDKPWDFDQPNWQSRLRDYAIRNGKLHLPTGIDYFVFSKGLWENLPPFAHGRTVLDNWLIYRTRSLGVPVIDATNIITAVHQNHDYSFQSSGKSGIKEGPEAQRNLKLAGGYRHVFLISDANWILTPKGLRRPQLTKQYLRRYIKNFPVLHPRFALLLRLARLFFSPRRLLRAVLRRIR